jgi:hypothetical protein
VLQGCHAANANTAGACFDGVKCKKHFHTQLYVSEVFRLKLQFFRSFGDFYTFDSIRPTKIIMNNKSI